MPKCYKCHICRIDVPDGGIEGHENGAKHRRRVEKRMDMVNDVDDVDDEVYVEDGEKLYPVEAKVGYCYPCESFVGVNCRQSHNHGKRHRKNIKTFKPGYRPRVVEVPRKVVDRWQDSDSDLLVAFNRQSINPQSPSEKSNQFSMMTMA